MGRWWRALVIAAIAVLSTSCSSTDPKADDSAPTVTETQEEQEPIDNESEPTGLIAFDLVPLDGRDAGELHVMGADGGDVSSFGAPFWAESNPAWSSDGERLAFVAAATKNADHADIFYMEGPEGEVTRVTRGPGNDLMPTWSPDGTRLAFGRGVFRRGPTPKQMDIYVINADGSGETALTDNEVIDADPDWSPDGNLIALSSDRAGTSDIWTMTPEGDSPQRLTATPHHDLGPTWSPDGTRIAFARSSGGQGSDLFVMNADGSDPQQLTHGSISVAVSTWSPDGNWIAFAGHDGERTDIWLIRAIGTGLERVSQGDHESFNPAWQPAHP